MGKYINRHSSLCASRGWEVHISDMISNELVPRFIDNRIVETMRVVDSIVEDKLSKSAKPHILFPTANNLPGQ